MEALAKYNCFDWVWFKTVALRMQMVTSIGAMQRLAGRWRGRGVRIGLVPTMGYLHAGHLSLVHEARRLVGKGGVVVVSLYVNPTQFAPTEDLSKYPRDLKRDLKLCRAAGVDVIFAPDDREMYPGKATGGYMKPWHVVEEGLALGMEGECYRRIFAG